MNAGSRYAAIGDLGLVSEIIERKKYTIAESRYKLGLTHAEMNTRQMKEIYNGKLKVSLRRVSAAVVKIATGMTIFCDNKFYNYF